MATTRRQLRSISAAARELGVGNRDLGALIRYLQIETVQVGQAKGLDDDAFDRLRKVVASEKAAARAARSA